MSRRRPIVAAVACASLAAAGCGHRDKPAAPQVSASAVQQARQACGDPAVPVGSGADGLRIEKVTGAARDRLRAAFGALAADGRTIAVRRVLQHGKSVAVVIAVPLPPTEAAAFTKGFLDQAKANHFAMSDPLDVAGMRLDVVHKGNATFAVGTRECRGVGFFSASRAAVGAVATTLLPLIR